MAENRLTLPVLVEKEVRVPSQTVATTVSESTPKPAWRVLIPFGTPYLYGMERAVIETFDALRPEVTTEFLISTMAERRRRPVIVEIEARGFARSFFPDTRDWPMVGRPRSLRHAWDLTVALVRGSTATLRRVIGCDVLYVPTPIAVTSLPAAIYSRMTGKQVIYQFHDLNPPAWLVRIWSVLVSGFVHNTELGRDHVLRRYPFVKRKRHMVAPPVIQTSRLWGSDPLVHAELEGKRNLLFIGRVDETKGIDLLLEAFRLLASEYPDVHLQVLGGCRDEAQFHRTVASMGLSSRVRLWGYRSDVYDFLGMAYLYVHPTPPSRCKESFGRGVVEAMCRGVPVVCFRSGALEEIVVHEQTGLVCDEETAACLASSIRRLLGDLQLRQSCARAGLRRFEELYSEQSVRYGWIEFLGCTGSDQR
jgi:glycosyltransferase involved in cell wall biosynthesis